ncbi:hypothetical protein H0H93_011955 [Arthromyces matolae]|nr:hypothetical protein H0H93_011955 [Arthromyces matolae]
MNLPPLRHILTSYFLCLAIATVTAATPVPTGQGNTPIAHGLKPLPSSPQPLQVELVHDFKVPDGLPKPDFSKTIEQLEDESDKSTLKLERDILDLAQEKSFAGPDYFSARKAIDESIMMWLHVEYSVILTLSGQGGSHKPPVGDRVKLQTRIEMMSTFCSLVQTKVLDWDHPGKLKDPSPKEQPGLLYLQGDSKTQMELYKKEIGRIQQACADNRCPNDPAPTGPAPSKQSPRIFQKICSSCGWRGKGGKEPVKNGPKYQSAKDIYNLFVRIDSSP